MNEAAVLASIALANELIKLIPQWVEAARKKGELTPEMEAAYKAHQETVYAQDYAKPGDENSS